MQVALFTSCLTEAFAPRALRACVLVLEKLGCEVVFPQAQTCCGQAHWNNGFRAQAEDLIARMSAVFAPYSHVVTPSGSCAAMVRHHFAPAMAAKTFEFCEFVTRVLRADLRALAPRWPGTVACHDSCHAREIGLAGAAAAMLQPLEGATIVPFAAAETCCGFGGLFATRYPQVSAALGRDKTAALAAATPTAVVSSDCGCALHLDGLARRDGTPLRFTSAAEVLAEALGLLAREAS